MSNPTSKRGAVQAVVIALGEFYNQELTKDQVRMYVEDLLDLDIEQLKETIVRYRRDPRNTRFPLPTVLRSMLNPNSNPRQVATEVAARIMKAVSLHGHTWTGGYSGVNGKYFEGWRGKERKTFPTWEEAATYELGELGVEVIRLESWQALCEDDTDKGIRFAQLRDRAESLYEKALRGDIHFPPSLPAPPPGLAALPGAAKAPAALTDKSQAGPQSIGSILTSITAPKESTK